MRVYNVTTKISDPLPYHVIHVTILGPTAEIRHLEASIALTFSAKVRAILAALGRSDALAAVDTSFEEPETLRAVVAGEGTALLLAKGLEEDPIIVA